MLAASGLGKLDLGFPSRRVGSRAGETGTNTLVSSHPAGYSIKSSLGTPEYVLACFQEEWRQRAWLNEAEPVDVGRQLPAFDTPTHEWREALDSPRFGWEVGVGGAQ